MQLVLQPVVAWKENCPITTGLRMKRFAFSPVYQKKKFKILVHSYTKKTSFLSKPVTWIWQGLLWQTAQQHQGKSSPPCSSSLCMGTTAQLMVFLLQKPLEKSYTRTLVDVTPGPGREVSLSDCWEHSPEVQLALSGQVKYTHNSCRTCRISHKSHIASKSYIISDKLFFCVCQATANLKSQSSLFYLVESPVEAIRSFILIPPQSERRWGKGKSWALWSEGKKVIKSYKRRRVIAAAHQKENCSKYHK